MINFARLTVAFAITTHLILAGRHVYASCDSPQYVEYGEKGIIKCSFVPGFKGIFWYLSENFEYQILIRLEQQEDGSVVPAGDGYTEGKLDILPDGSLVMINNTNYHNQSFKIVHLDKNSFVEERYVEVLTTIIPKHNFPVINVCSRNQLCLIENQDVVTLICSFQRSKPPMEVQWYRQSHEGIEKLEEETVITEDGEWTFSSTSNVNVASLINGPLIAFICRVSSPVLKSQTMESTVVIDTTEKPWPSLAEGVREEKYFLINSTAEVPCNDVRPFIFVWKQLYRSYSKTLAFAKNDRNGFVGNMGTILNATKDGSLIIPNISFENEGLYSCTYFDGTRYISDLNQVSVFVLPNPPTVIADGCAKDKNVCEIFLPDSVSVFNISCHLFGVYPDVTLSMDDTLHSDTQNASQNTYSVERGVLYDSTVTKKFPPIGCSAFINATCYVSRPGLVALIQDKAISVRSEACEATGSKAPVIVISVLIAVILSSVGITALFCYRRRTQNSRNDIEKQQSREMEHHKLASEENEDGMEGKEPKLEDTSADSTNDVTEATDKKETLKVGCTSTESQEAPSKMDQTKSDGDKKSNLEQTEEEEAPLLNDNTDESGGTEESKLELETIAEKKTDFPPKHQMGESDVYSGNNEDQFSASRMKEVVDLILNYPMKHAISNSLFDKDVIETIHNTPVMIAITKNVSAGAKVAGTAIAVFGAALAFVTFGFGVVLALAGTALGVTGVAIGLSSKEIFEDESKWRRVRPAFELLIKIQRDIAKMIAVSSIGYNTIESFSKAQRYISTEIVGNMHNQAEESLKRIESKDCSSMGYILDNLRSTMEKTVSEMIQFTNSPEANRLQRARDEPFNNLCEDVLACLNNALTERSTSSFLDVIEMMFWGDRNGKAQFDVIRDSNKRTEIIKDNITKVERGVLAAGIILNAAEVDTNMEFLGTTAQNLLESKNDKHKTLLLVETADLMEKMNAIFEKFSEA